jgi:hypothetical protein
VLPGQGSITAIPGLIPDSCARWKAARGRTAFFTIGLAWPFIICRATRAIG